MKNKTHQWYLNKYSGCWAKAKLILKLISNSVCPKALFRSLASCPDEQQNQSPETCWVEIFQQCHLPSTCCGTRRSQSKSPLGSIAQLDRIIRQMSQAICCSTGHAHLAWYACSDICILATKWDAGCWGIQNSLRTALNLLHQIVLLSESPASDFLVSARDTGCYSACAGCLSINQALADL